MARKCPVPGWVYALVQVISDKPRSFTAGFAITDDKVTLAAPILARHLLGKTTEEARQVIRKKGWKAILVRGEPVLLTPKEESEDVTAMTMIHATAFLAADIEDAERQALRYEDRAGSVERLRALGFDDETIEQALGVTVPHAQPEAVAGRVVRLNSPER